MPMLILTITKYLNELFQDCCVATITFLCKLCRIVIMAINTAVMLIVTILCTKHGRTYRAREMLDVVFSLESGDVGAAQCSTASEA